MHRFSLALILPRLIGIGLLLALWGPAHAAPIQMPAPIAALPELNSTEMAIIEGMAKRGWFSEKNEDGRILAAIHVRTHTAKVWISFDTKQISFAYGGSDNLRCKPQGDSCSSIHNKYNSWAANLAMDIAGVISIKRAEAKYAQ